MALTQDELDQVYNYVMGKGQSLAGLPDGGNDLSSMYLAPILKYSPGGAATLVRLAVSVLKGDSAYQVWVNEPGNAGKTLSDFFLSIKGAKGDPFTFADFTPEQLADLALTYDKLTPEQKEEMKLHFGDLTEADILILQKPATEAADEVREQMSQISQNASAAIKAASDAAGNAQDAADNVQDGKTTQFEIGTVESGAAPSASLTDNGVDATGNPKKKLNLVMQKGDNAKSPTVQTGTITAGDPASEVTFTFAEVGMTEDGRPIWRVDGSIPRGQQGPPGTGSGNVSVDGTGLVIGKKYLFVPSSGDSTAGTFVEYVAPEIPEQVQPDWNATEGKGAILHKPGDATADASGLMSADQFQKLEKLNPSYLSNAVTGKKVEYTDAGKLLFEGKETFAVNADGELTLDGKKMSELGGGDANVINIPPDIMRLSSDSTSDAIFEIWGGQQLLLEIVKNFNKSTVYTINTIEDSYMMLLYPIVEIQYEDDFNYMISVHIQIQENDIGITTEVLEGIASANVLRVGNVINTSVGNTTADRIYLSYGGDNGLDNSDLVWNNNERYDDETGEGSRHLAYGGSKSIRLTNQGDGTKALMDDGTYKVVGGDYTLPAATSAALGGIKVGYTAAEKNYPVQLDGSDKAYVNVPWTDTTYSPATQSANGLMSFGDKKKLDRIGSYTAATTVANLDANYENIEISNLSANASLSVNLTGTAYDTWSIYVAIYCSSARTITIPTSGNYISMIGSSLTCPAGKWTELHLKCLGGKWRIAKLEQE